MHKDREMKQFLSRLEVPAHRPDLPERIIARSLAQRPAPVRQGGAFTTWWARLRTEHGPKLAVAASVAIVSIVVFDPAGKITAHYIENQQMAEMERYTVDGIPLLADVALMDEQDLRFDDVVSFSENS
jgi:hypothetical protein